MHNDILSDILIRAIAPTAGLLFVAEETGSLTGSSGWASFGLAGLVIAWLLLKHLPEKDKQLADLMAAYDKKFEDSRTAFITAFKAQADQNSINIDKVNAANKDTIKDVLDHCNEEARRLREDCDKRQGGRP